MLHEKHRCVGKGLLCLLVLCTATVATAAPRVFVLGDMEKITGTRNVKSSPSFLSEEKIVTLSGAGNEVIALQVVLQAYKDEQDLDVRVSDLVGPSTIPADPNIQLFLAHYIQPVDASYSWGPGRQGILSWRGLHYPDALIPFYDPYDAGGAPVCVPFSIDPGEHRNATVWIDIFIPEDTPAGRYMGKLEALQDGRVFASFPIHLEVYPFSLPDENHGDAFGELYRETGVMFDSGVKFKEAPEQDWPIYKRYLQMAHAHRFLAQHRAENGPIPLRPDGEFADELSDRWGEDWSLFTPYVDPILSGELFTEEEGYLGPRAGVGPGIYLSPFIETFFGQGQLVNHLEQHKGKIDPALLATLEANAARLWQEIEANGWQDVRWFAYILDEVNGPSDHLEKNVAGDTMAKFVNGAIADIQAALDRGTGNQRRIHLMWTSHVDASIWAGTDADLRPVITWWAPNGHAVNVDFYQPLAAQPGTTVWFYHSGHPAIGNHTINQLGIDLRLWGLLCSRYDLDGSFWWSMMNFAKRYDDEDYNPYQYPNYRLKETRWGNGVLFYPGSRLEQNGYQGNIAGPVSSMRMKAYRRGLQDREYCWMAGQAGHGAEVDDLLVKLIPAAFSEAPEGFKQGTWSQDPEEYYALRRKLAALIMGEKQEVPGSLPEIR